MQLAQSVATLPKRIFDVVVAAGALLLLWPVLLAVALWIKWDSPGPVFFRQQRVGRHGALFNIHKFRVIGLWHIRRTQCAYVGRRACA